jgi:DNA polymerase I-like protein with 3'-5' exonuclease and polymerase domains
LKTLSSLSPALKGFPDLVVHVAPELSEVAALKPSAVLALGQEPLATLQLMGICPKNRKITSMRDVSSMRLPQGTPVRVSYSPGIGDVDHGLYVTLLTDAGMAARLAFTGSLTPKLGQYRFVDRFDELVQRIKDLFAKTGQPVETSLDLETVGLDEYRLPGKGHPGAYIVSIQISCEIGKSDIKHIRSRAEEEAYLSDFVTTAQLSWILSSPMVSLRGANLKYDLRWLWARGGLTCTNYKFDTTLVGSLLDENRANGLKAHVRIYAPALGGYEEALENGGVDISRMDLADPVPLLPYAGGDTDGCLQVAKAMKAELLQDKALSGFYVNILHPAARAFEVIERGGVFVDREKFRALEADLNTEAVKLVHKAKRVLGGMFVARYGDDSKAGGMNITSPTLIKDYMFSKRGLNLKPLEFTPKPSKKTGEPVPACGMEHLVKFKDVPEAAEFIACLSEYASLTKTLGTYVTGFLKCLRSDGRFHPSYWFFVGDRDAGEGGTNTGRLSCKDPAFQTIPKHTVWAKRIRECYPAPDGYLIGERDYSQGELKVVACIANEQNMLKSYRDGLDLHVVTSGRFAGFTYEEMMEMKNSGDPTRVDAYEETRQLGKAGNFGLLYGMQVEGFMAYAEANYGVKLTYEAAEAIRNSFFASYPGLIDYHKQYKGFAKRFGQVRSPLGRVRHLPMINSTNREKQSQAERQSINSPVQGTLSDMLLWSFSEMMAQQPEWYESGIIMPFAAVHDAAYDYIREDKALEVARYAVDVMENLPFHKVGWNPQLKFTADLKLGANMAYMKKVVFN